jgi:CRP-like cAMP-binding protein
MEILNAFSNISPLSSGTKQQLSEWIVSREYPKGQHLLNLWQVPKHLYYVVRGVTRIYYIKDGLDVTDYFAMENQFVGAVPALFTSEPSHKAIEVLEDSVIESIPYFEMEQMCTQNIEVCNLGRKIGIIGFLEGQQRMEDMRFLPAAQRYEELLRKYPGITNRVPLKHIASLLGITPVSLSRIRGGNQ